MKTCKPTCKYTVRIYLGSGKWYVRKCLRLVRSKHTYCRLHKNGVYHNCRRSARSRRK